MDLTTDTVAVVTGGGHGIGLALADRFAGAGCKLVLGMPPRSQIMAEVIAAMMADQPEAPA